MNDEKNWPTVGEKLVHKFRKKPGSVVAIVVSVDRTKEEIVLKVGKHVFPSLSAAAQSISGWACNGWTYWGLKKQRPKKRTPRV